MRPKRHKEKKNARPRFARHGAKKEVNDPAMGRALVLAIPRTESRIATDDDDALEELPPVDGDDDEPAGTDEADDSLEESAADGDPLDDSTGEADPVEELAVEERSWLDDAEPADGVDIDASDLYGTTDTESAIGDIDTPGVEGEDFGLGEDESAAVLDGGEEGPLGGDEELSEADLPELDADDDGDLDDGLVIEVDTVSEVPLDDDVPFPWAASPWGRVGSAPDVGSALSVACGARAVFALVLAAGGADARLVRVDLEGGVGPLTARSLPPLRSGRLHLISNELWVEGEGGAFRSRDAGASFEAASFASDTETGNFSSLLPRFTLSADAKLTAAVRGSGGTLGAVASPLLGRAWLVWVPDEPGAGPRVVAEIGDDAEVLSLAWDETRGVVWAAGRFGLLAFQTKTDSIYSVPPRCGA
jgi:hypothetical protein